MQWHEGCAFFFFRQERKNGVIIQKNIIKMQIKKAIQSVQRYEKYLYGFDDA